MIIIIILLLIILIDENDIKQNMAEYNDFVVYEEDDFEKAFFEDKNK